MITLVVIAVAVGAFLYARHRFRMWRITCAEWSKLRALGEAKVHRPMSQRIMSVLPGSAIRRIMQWRPDRRIRPTVRIARRGLSGGSIRIRPDRLRRTPGQPLGQYRPPSSRRTM